jgi:ABC-type sugar transport system ATPase subunit
MISNIGSEKYLHVDLGNVNCTVRAPKEAAFRPGQSIFLTINPERLHIFYEGNRI